MAAGEYGAKGSADRATTVPEGSSRRSVSAAVMPAGPVPTTTHRISRPPCRPAPPAAWAPTPSRRWATILDTATARSDPASSASTDGSVLGALRSNGSTQVWEKANPPNRSTRSSTSSMSPAATTRLTTSWMSAIPSSSASRAVSRPTWTELKVGSTTTRAVSNPRARARPKCSTPAWVSMTTISSCRRRMPATAAESSACSGHRQPPPAWATPPMTSSRTSSGPETDRRSTRSEVSGFRRSMPPAPSPGRAPVFSSM